MMSVLVTGACGFIGSYLIPALLERGYEVVATDITNEPGWIADLEAVRYYRADLGRDADVYKLMGAVRPEKVIHLASLLAAPCENDPGLGYRVNFGSTLALLDGCRTFGANRFVMTSSISVFGKNLPEPVFDDEIKNPLTIYGQTKLACEHLMEWYQRVYSMSSGAVRFPWVFGPGRTTGITAEYSSKLLDAIASGEKLVISTPEEKGDWLYIKDAVKALLMLIELKEQPRIAYNIMSGLYTVREAMTIARSLFPDAEIEIGEGTEVTSPYPTSFDDSKAREEIGWKPDYSIEEAMKEHVEIIRKKIN
ncbi:MAG: NAD(P)-dependent oxidoreductase [Desulfobacterales bacterium]|nr:NAD(P)-dependent oxidoreductase [Desulfobacterales bacterium]